MPIYMARLGSVYVQEFYCLSQERLPFALSLIFLTNLQIVLSGTLAVIASYLASLRSWFIVHLYLSHVTLLKKYPTNAGKTSTFFIDNNDSVQIWKAAIELLPKLAVLAMLSYSNLVRFEACKALDTIFCLVACQFLSIL